MLTFQLDAPVVTFALMTAGAFSWNISKLFSKLKLVTNNLFIMTGGLAWFRTGDTDYLDWYSHDDEYPCTRVWRVLPQEKFFKLGAMTKPLVLTVLTTAIVNPPNEIEPSCLKWLFHRSTFPELWTQKWDVSWLKSCGLIFKGCRHAMLNFVHNSPTPNLSAARSHAQMFSGNSTNLSPLVVTMEAWSPKKSREALSYVL